MNNLFNRILLHLLMNVYFFEPFESKYKKNFSNSEFNLNDILFFNYETKVS